MAIVFPPCVVGRSLHTLACFKITTIAHGTLTVCVECLSLPIFVGSQAALTAEVAEKEAMAAKNRQKRKDKDAMIAQLTKATAENEAQLAELQVWGMIYWDGEINREIEVEISWKQE